MNGHLLRYIDRQGLPQPYQDFFSFHGARAQDGGHMSKGDIETAEGAMAL